MRIWLVAVVIACGSSKPPTEGGKKCEPGRCLDDLSKAIAPHRAAARECYDAALKKDPKLATGGRIIINMEIDATGEVVEATQGIQSEQITDHEVIDCVIGVVMAVKFAPVKSGKRAHGFHQFEFAGR